MEVLVSVCLLVVLLSISLSAASRAAKPDALLLATDRLLSLVSQVRAEAIATNAQAALIIDNESDSTGYLQKLNLATFQVPPERNYAVPAVDALTLEKKWVKLPENIQVEVGYSNELEPNAFYASSPQGGGTIGLSRAAGRGGATERHPAVLGVVFDQYGAVTAEKGGERVPYVNTAQNAPQQGVYLILRDVQKRPDAYQGEKDLTGVSKIYISALTGWATKG